MLNYSNANSSYDIWQLTKFIFIQFAFKQKYLKTCFLNSWKCYLNSTRMLIFKKVKKCFHQFLVKIILFLVAIKLIDAHRKSWGRVLNVFPKFLSRVSMILLKISWGIPNVWILSHFYFQVFGKIFQWGVLF